MGARDEEMHRVLYRAHARLLSAGDDVHTVLVMLASNCRHEETRKKFSDAGQLLAKARDLADEALSTATKARTEVIRNTGCDNSCQATTPTQIEGEREE